MFQYRIAIPSTFSDELVSLLRERASLEGVVPLPVDLRDDDPMSVQGHAPMAVFLVHDPDRHSVVAIKSWIETRSDPQLDVRGEEPGEGFKFSFAQNSLDDVTAWAARQTARVGS